MSVDQRLREAELAFLNAPFRPDGWLHAIRQLAAVTGSAVAQLCGGGLNSLTFNYFSEERHDPHGHLVNPVIYGPENWRINTTHRARTIEFERDYAAYRAVRPTSFYDDAVSDLDLPFGCQSALMMDQNGMTGMALLRSSRNGPCTPETIAQFAVLARQAHRATRVQIALGEEAAELMVSGTAGRHECTILLDRFGNVLALTEAAELLFDEAQALTMRGHRVTLTNKAEDRALEAACARLMASDGVSGPLLHETVVGRSAATPQGRWRLVAVRLGGEAKGLLCFEPQLALTFTPL